MVVLVRNLVLLAGVLAIIFAPGYLVSVYKWAWGLDAAIFTRIFAVVAACYGPGFLMIALMKMRKVYRVMLTVLFGAFATYLLLPYFI